MYKPWENENCADILAYNSIYPIPVAAALWCGVPPKEVDKYLSTATEVTPGIFRHPQIKCLEVKCRAMHNAIIANVLPVSRENGRIATDHVAPGRRHVSRQDLKDWITKEFPSNKPSFLFDELEQKSHAAINPDTYRTLQADRDALRLEVENAKKLIQKITHERDALSGENQSLKAMVEKNTPVDSRSETTYLNIIGGMLELMTSKSQGGQSHSIFKTQTAIIDALHAHYPNKEGLSQRNLEKKFSEANKSIQSV